MQNVMVFLVGLLLGAGQLCFKVVGDRVAHATASKGLAQTLIAMPQFYGAMALYGFATLMYIWILSKDELVTSYLVIVAVSFLVTLLGAQLFGEKISMRLIVASLLIITGIVVART